MKRFAQSLVLFVLVAMLVAGCAPAPTATPIPPTPEPTAVPPTAVPPTAVPPTAVPPTAVPTAAPTMAATATPIPMVTGHLLLATTTSTRDSGLLNFILPDFEQQYGVKVDVVAVGSGQAMKIGQDGNAEVLLVHSPVAEQKFMADGHGIRREDVMYNDFVIVGPASDPAGIKGMSSAVEAFTTIANKQALFISRADNSGTDVKEHDIWRTANISPTAEMKWYIKAGQGMGAVLTMADEQLAYTLSDRATYLSRKKAGLQLDIMSEGDKALFNPYGVIQVDPAKNPVIKADLAKAFVDWIISVPEQEKIGTYGVADWGQPLFFPSSAPYLCSKAALKITGKVTKEMCWTEAQIKAMPTLDAERANKQGTIEKYTGVSIAELLKLAGPAADATTLALVDENGSTADAPLADITNCEKCIVSFRSKGGFSIVAPDYGSVKFADTVQIKGVVEIQVK